MTETPREMSRTGARRPAPALFPALAPALAALVLASAAPAQPAAPHAPPTPPETRPPSAPPAPGTPPGDFPALTVTPYARVVPKDEVRTIGFFTSLYPDCTSQGPVVARLVAPPQHGSVEFAPEESYPRYAPSSPLASCNAKRVPGLKMRFAPQDGYEGLDAYRVVMIVPDGSAFELDVKVSVR